jgi:hypothetical protein
MLNIDSAVEADRIFDASPARRQPSWRWLLRRLFSSDNRLWLMELGQPVKMSGKR